MIEVLRRLDRALASLERGIVLVCITLLVLLSTYQLVIRNLDTGTPSWIDPLLHQLVLWTGFLGAALAVRSRTHIRMDLLSHRLLPPWSNKVAALISLTSAGICLFLAGASWRFVTSEREMALRRVAGLPSWVFATIIPVGFALMAVHFLLRIWIPAEPPATGMREEGLE